MAFAGRCGGGPRARGCRRKLSRDFAQRRRQKERGLQHDQPGVGLVLVGGLDEATAAVDELNSMLTDPEFVETHIYANGMRVRATLSAAKAGSYSRSLHVELRRRETPRQPLERQNANPGVNIRIGYDE